MARKKCSECLTCYNVFWYDNERYYHCWLCQKTYKGRNDELKECEDPRYKVNVPIPLEEQEDGQI